jgi:N-acetylglucosamine-6-phosphate deacetylase
VQRDALSLTCRLVGKELGADGAFLLRLHRDGDRLAGACTTPDGRTLAFGATARPTPVSKDGDQPKDKDKAADRFVPPAIAPLPTPLGGYGFVTEPVATEFAIVGAVVWTSDGRGNLRDGAVHVRSGRIVFAGPRSEMPQLPETVPVIDGTGKHVTPGLIDCHSHTGIARGVNEGGQAVTAEVRIEDVLDPDDVSWYRQLAGGVTTVNRLHGSANAIGGQSCTTKNRWGMLQPDAMHLAGAPPGIKWALGENPRRANGGGDNSRYPSTRMGVEALLRDRFAAATVYRAEHAAYQALAPAARARVLPPRRDLELEAIAEILAGARWIHCHSYRQDEIFMLCGLAQEHGLKIGTFQHVLEGYKVADAIAANARGASSFTDWWAYKFEVYDAIPENGAILHAAGVVTSFNSDSDELARRLNTEAGKAVKYGGLPPWEALCFVTRNPAQQLGIFERTGSLTAGKDADLVLWSDDPLSYAARCEATWVDGVQRFSLASDAAARTAIAAERQRLLQKALAGGKGRTARERDPKDAYWAAEDLTGDYCCRTEGDR